MLLQCTGMAKNDSDPFFYLFLLTPFLTLAAAPHPAPAQVR